MVVEVLHLVLDVDVVLSRVGILGIGIGTALQQGNSLQCCIASPRDELARLRKARLRIRLDILRPPLQLIQQPLLFPHQT
jgi:hypothetical protein